MTKIYVLWWRYSDGSGYGILRAYLDHRRAAEDFNLISEDTTRQYKLDEVPVFGDVDEGQVTP